MLLLAVDTSGKNGSLALVRGNSIPTSPNNGEMWGTQKFEVLELVPLAGRMYSAQIIPELQNALSRQKLKVSDIDAYVVASGPGSFTGLRVGLSTVKALSEVLHKPIAAVSVLEAAARMTQQKGKVVVALDAGRKQAFVGEYEFDQNFRAVRAEESLVSLDPAGAKAPILFGANGAPEAAPYRKLFSPDQNVRDLLAVHGVSVAEIHAPAADIFAYIGYEKIIAGETTPAEVLEANYIRASDAELFSLPKLMS